MSGVTALLSHSTTPILADPLPGESYHTFLLSFFFPAWLDSHIPLVLWYWGICWPTPGELSPAQGNLLSVEHSLL